MTSIKRLAMPLTAGLALVAAAASISTAAAQTCSARSTAVAPTVVELYTSEGCNSCPPADKWLSRLKAEPSVIALAFHVDYWDRLGWKDRFASPAFTQRQAEQQRSSGARFSYTPQVLIDGADRPDWPRASTAARERAAAPVAIELVRDGKRFTAMISVPAGTPTRLAGYWAVTEQGHVSAVKAGENEGVTLQHDFVVRQYQPVGAWQARSDAPQTLQFDSAIPADPAHTRRVNFIVVDAQSGRPVQAVSLGC